MPDSLFDYQIEAVNKLQNGNILCGGVGSGKSRTALAYYVKVCGGDPFTMGRIELKMPRNLIIITTARKRDTQEWDLDMAPFSLSEESSLCSLNVEVKVDSWNNIQKYIDIKDSFFIFDEQRVVGYGAWVKAFLKITKNNQWILLSATPGDTWTDYIPVFVANGFYRNKTDFIQQHVVYSRYSKFPKVDRYVNTGRLIRLRNKILVNMTFERSTIRHDIDIWVTYDSLEYKGLIRNRWNYDKNQPFQNAAELCYALRKSVNVCPERLYEVQKLLAEKGRVIVFYNFDYELDILKNAEYWPGVEIAEWNGHKHQPIPKSKEWLYLVQYTAGSEGWNCILTDTIVFYSQNYSYKMMVQAAGRIDRLNTPFTDLYFYHIKSRSGIDIAIAKALKSKKKFNETKFVEGGH